MKINSLIRPERLTAALLIATCLGLSACCPFERGTDVDPNHVYHMGECTARYRATTPEHFGNVTEATKKALDQLGHVRTSETPGTDKITLFARAAGDVQISIEIYKKLIETKDKGKQEWIYVTIRYGTWGNYKESEQIISQITGHLSQEAPDKP